MTWIQRWDAPQRVVFQGLSSTPCASLWLNVRISWLAGEAASASGVWAAERRSAPARLAPEAFDGLPRIFRLRRVEPDQPKALAASGDQDINGVAVHDALNGRGFAAERRAGRRGAGRAVWRRRLDGWQGRQGCRPGLAVQAVPVVGAPRAVPEIAADVGTGVRRARVPAVVAGTIGIRSRGEQAKK